MNVNSKRVDNPIYKVIMYLNKHDPDLIDNEKLEFLIKNLNTHFKKLFYMVSYINKIQKDEDYINKYDQTKLVSISAVEYCYYKISTIWDIAYQIADKLIFPKQKNGNKYEYLERHFEQYADTLPNLNLDWYTSLNKIRNKIVHGGITVNPYYINDENVKHKICFQAYNSNLDDLIQPHYVYSNERNNNINFADYYFAFQTHLLYSYLCDFFDFVLLELNKERSHDLNDLSLDDLPHEFFGRFHETWLLSDVDQFCEITREMIALQLADGRLNSIGTINQEDVERFFEVFPFCLMQRIKDGGWELMEKKANKKNQADA
ncbi:hypothetical protein ACK34K_04075 [Aeromonas veronii]